MSSYQLLLFDRDGTLTYEQRSFHRDLSALPAYPFTGVTLKQLDESGCRLGIATNQSGIARGYWSMKEVDVLHERFCREWDVTPRFYLCPHHPDDGCRCRKPESELLQRAMSDCGVQAKACLMIGDSLADYGAAQSAGVAFALVLTGRGRATRDQLPEPPAMILDNIAGLNKHLT
ncbi:MAG: HAD-IIIA family hydrolase [Fidelibacterota bacterium]|nr:MAG: HAD-IIIA family hydrolase [Candidatus Neomarinimicrobiota bacterium]